MIHTSTGERSARPTARLAVLVGLAAIACSGQTGAGEGAGLPPHLAEVGAGLVVDAAAIGCLGERTGWSRRDEVEPHAAVNPTDAEHIVVAWMARVRGERGAIVAAVSRTGGRSWDPPRVLPFSECSGGPAGLRATSDPWVSFGPDGRVWVSAIGWTPGENLDSASVVGVVTSDDGGATWSDLLPVSESRSSEFMHDNTAIAADPFRPGTAWVATTYWGPEGRPVAVSRTGDGGRTWSPLAFATESAWGTPAHGAPQPVVTAERVYVFFGDGPAGSRPSLVRREHGREDWSDAIPIYEGAPIEGVARFPGTEDEIRIAEDILHAAFDPGTGNLWAVFTSAADDDPARPTVRISVSPDGGASWAPAIPVGEPNEATWRPTLAVAPGGPAVVTYFRAAPGTGAARALDAGPGAGAAGSPDPFDTEVRLRTFAASPEGIAPGVAATVDRFVWRARADGSRFLGDYHGLVMSGEAAVALYARTTPDGIRVVAARNLPP